MDHGEDADRLISEFVDQPLTEEEAFAHVGVGKFRHGAPELGVRGQFVGEVEQRSTTCWAW